ncbi:MAG: DUF465 domain-containing protein [Deltaproteobacteria bacterium]|nr:DUF465 domain-containing protein [Deltaproteobacteria bacterium]
MENSEKMAIVSLLDRDPELKQYYEEHQELEKKLDQFQSKLHLSPDEEVEKKRLQKMKLVGKDKIMEILERHRHTSS